MRLPKVAFLAVLVSFIGFTAGCDNKPKGDGKNLSSRNEEGHPEKGPHGGAIAEFGDDEEYHLEFLVNHDTHEATVYVLGSDAKTAKPIDAKELEVVLDLKEPVTLKLEPHSQKGDAAGVASRFSGTHDVLAKKMDFQGTIKGKVNGKERDGKFKEEGDHHNPNKK